MLDMGFADVMASITASLPRARQTLLLSATIPDDIRKISRSIQREPVSIKADSVVAEDNTTLEQLFFEIQKQERDTALLALFEHYQPQNAMVFCNTKKQCDEVAHFLQAARYRGGRSTWRPRAATAGSGAASVCQ